MTRKSLQSGAGTAIRCPPCQKPSPVVMSRAQQAKRISEQELQDAIADCARAHGWLVAHFAPARTEKGYRTPARYDAKGFPDLVLSRNGVSLFWECKREGEQPTADQRVWLVTAPGRVVYPSQWLSGELEVVLK